MEKVTIKAYALKHKLSIFNVMKMVKSNKLKSVIVEYENRDITYIILDEKIEEELKVEKSLSNKVTLENMNSRINSLKDEMEVLKKEINLLKEKE